MSHSTIERAAYLAAHRIMQADLSSPQFACPGTRRSKTIDAIAGIIKGVMEAGSEDEQRLRSWTQCLYGSKTPLMVLTGEVETDLERLGLS